DEGGDHGRGAGQHLHVQVALQAGADEPETWVGDHRGARLADQRDLRPALDLLRQLHRPLGLVSLVVGDEAGLRDVEPLEQEPGAAGVLAGDEVRLAQRLARPRAQVLKIADRRRADDQATRHQSSTSPTSSIAMVAAPIMPASGPSAAAATGVWFMGGRARSASSARAGSRSRSPAAIAPPPMTIMS